MPEHHRPLFKFCPPRILVVVGREQHGRHLGYNDIFPAQMPPVHRQSFRRWIIHNICEYPCMGHVKTTGVEFGPFTNQHKMSMR